LYTVIITTTISNITSITGYYTVNSKGGGGGGGGSSTAGSSRSKQYVYADGLCGKLSYIFRLEE
jgi:hypothetical protein